MIRSMQVEDDFLTVAKLIYATDDFIFPFLFGKPKQAIPGLAKLVTLEHNAFSYRHITVDIESEIRGILLENDDTHDQRETKDFLQAFSFWALLRLMLKQIVLFPVFIHSNQHSRYIQNVCVDPLLRGNGIGTGLLLDAIHRAKQDHISFLRLDVDIKNPGALRLYQKHGFRIVKTRRIWGIIPFSYAMERSIA